MPSSYAKQKSMTCHFVSCCRRCLRYPCGGTQRAVANSCRMKAPKSARRCFSPAFLRLLQVILFGPRILYTWTRSQGAPEYTQYTHPSQFELIDSHINALAFGEKKKWSNPVTANATNLHFTQHKYTIMACLWWRDNPKRISYNMLSRKKENTLDVYVTEKAREIVSGERNSVCRPAALSHTTAAAVNQELQWHCL